MGNQENQRNIDFNMGCNFTGRNLETKVLDNIEVVRTAETKYGFVTDRGFFDYLDELEGLKATLDYIRNLSSSNRVVDVGTGMGLAWSQLSRHYGNGLEFWATGLVDYDCNERFNGRFKNTSAEIMEGFETASVGGIVAVFSIAYGSPKQCIDRLDDILVPGGVIKACFRKSDRNHFNGDCEFKTHHLFTERLRELNYDMVISENVVLAIKSGGLQKASDLMEQDIYALNRFTKFGSKFIFGP